MAKKKAAPPKKKTKAPVKKGAPTKKAPARKKAAVKKGAAKKALARPVTAKKTAPAKKAAVKKVVKKAAPPKAKSKAPAKSRAKAKIAPKKALAPKKAAPTKVAPKAKPPVAPAKSAAPKKPAPKAGKPAPAPKATALPKAPAKQAPPKKAVKAPAAKPAKTKEPIIAVMTGIEPLGAPIRQLKRALKERFQLEFYLRATPGSLYDLLSTPSGLSEWFCNDVNVRGDEFTFVWGSDSQVAQCLSRKYGELIRFRWDDDDDPGSFFELRIRIDPMTNETCLVVTDHAWPQDLEEAKALWGSQIHTLARVLGA
ncbi:MAG: START-like domain-containing protein [Flavobacteriales bacterium]